MSLLSKIYVKVTESTKKKKSEMKLLSRREIKSVLKLFYEEGWVDFTYSDLDYMFKTSPRGCFKFVSDDMMIGVTFALCLENGVVYPNSSIISQKHRNSVKYHDVMLKYSDYLKSIAKFEVMYSAMWLVDIYKDAMGYKPISTVSRVSIDALPKYEGEHQAIDLTEENMQKISSFLEGIYKSERETLLKHALDSDYSSATIFDDQGEVLGFSMMRELPKHRHIGPIVAYSEEVAHGLVDKLLESESSKPVMMDGDEIHLPGFLRAVGAEFTSEGTKMKKMIRGDESLMENSDHIYAIYSHYLS